MIGPMNQSGDAHEVCSEDAPEDAHEVFPADAYEECMPEHVTSDHLEDAYEECMPEHLTIGTKKAFKNGYAFPYEKKKIGSETVYVCNKGSEWARSDEVLVLRCEGGTWTAYDSAVSADGSTLQCRQPIIRCLATDITQPGMHKWQGNVAADYNEAGRSVDWQGTLWAETRVP